MKSRDLDFPFHIWDIAGEVYLKGGLLDFDSGSTVQILADSISLGLAPCVPGLSLHDRRRHCHSNISKL